LAQGFKAGIVSKAALAARAARLESALVETGEANAKGEIPVARLTVSRQPRDVIVDAWVGAIEKSLIAYYAGAVDAALRGDLPRARRIEVCDGVEVRLTQTGAPAADTRHAPGAAHAATAHAARAGSATCTADSTGAATSARSIGGSCPTVGARAATTR